MRKNRMLAKYVECGYDMEKKHGPVLTGQEEDI